MSKQRLIRVDFEVRWKTERETSNEILFSKMLINIHIVDLIHSRLQTEASTSPFICNFAMFSKLFMTARQQTVNDGRKSHW